MRSQKYGLNLDLGEERRRLVMHIISADPAVEWLRPMTPNARMVGPILPTPPAPLPAELEVRHAARA
jgi:glucuronosyltransferase